MTTRYQTLHASARKVVDDANTEIGELQKQIECICSHRHVSFTTNAYTALTLEKKEAERRTEEVASMYKEKSKRCQTLSQLYEALKNKVQAEQTRDAAAVSAEHTLQSMGSITMPEPYAHRQLYQTQSRSVAQSPSMKKTPSRARPITDYQGVEQLHPFQRSGSATGAQTSSELRAATSSMRPPIHAAGRQVVSRLSTSTTPAQRITLTRPTASYTFPHSNHRTSMSQQFGSRPADRYAIEGQDLSRNDQYLNRRVELTPNIRSRMPADRGIY